jgi:hypothetical protein
MSLQNLDPAGLASWLAMSNLLRVLRDKGILTEQDATEVIAGAIGDIEGDDRSLAREARELLDRELRSTTDRGT